MRKSGAFAASLAVTTVLGGCGGSSSGIVAAQSHKVGGTVTGLAGTGLVLVDNGTDNLPITGNGTFAFPTSLASGKTYSVTVATQPTASSKSATPQTCFVSSGTGTVQDSDVQSVLVSCVNDAARFAYAADGGSSEISGYSINNQTGALTAISGSPFPAGANPESLTIHPSGKFAYASNAGDNTISEYMIDSSSGALAQISGSPLPVPPTVTPLAGFSIMPVVIDPSGKLAFVANPSVPWSQSGPPQTENLNVFSIDGASGALAEINGSPMATGSDLPSFVAINASDSFAYVINDEWQVGADQCSLSVFSIDPTTASVAAVTGSPFAVPPSCRAQRPVSFILGPSGDVAYLTNPSEPDVLFQWLTLDPATGAVTGSGEPTTAPGCPCGAPAIDPSGKFLYLAGGPATAGQSASVYAFAVNASSGALTSIGAVPTGAANPVVIDPTGKFLYVASTTSIYAYSMDSSTGALTAVSGSPFSVASSSDSITAQIAIDPSGRFAYVPSAKSDLIYAMSIDPSTGALTAVTGSPFPSGASPGKITFRY